MFSDKYIHEAGESLRELLERGARADPVGR
jgi:hypothetical protein